MGVAFFTAVFLATDCFLGVDLFVDFLTAFLTDACADFATAVALSCILSTNASELF